MANLHSHAFQRAMAGLAEVRGPANDSFWSWRTVMYKFALAMTPEHVEAVAAKLYMEMLEAGFSRVGEFHYLHHDRDGSAYANIAELAERIGAASHRDRYRPDAAAGLLCPFRLRRCRADRGPAAFHQFARKLRKADGGLPRQSPAGSMAPSSGSRRTACAP